MTTKSKLILLLLSFSGMLIGMGCEKKKSTQDDPTPTGRTNYISLKQDGVQVEVDSINASSRVIISGVYKGVKIIFFDKARNRYDFTLQDSNLNLNYVTPKRYQGFGSSFIHINNGMYFAGNPPQSYFTCTKSDPITKRFSGHFEIMLLNEPNRTDTIMVTEGVVENITLP